MSVRKNWSECSRTRDIVNFSHIYAYPPRVHLHIRKIKLRKWKLIFFGFNANGDDGFEKFFPSKPQAEQFADLFMEQNKELDAKSEGSK